MAGDHKVNAMMTNRAAAMAMAERRGGSGEHPEGARRALRPGLLWAAALLLCGAALVARGAMEEGEAGAFQALAGLFAFVAAIFAGAPAVARRHGTAAAIDAFEALARNEGAAASCVLTDANGRVVAARGPGATGFVRGSGAHAVGVALGAIAGDGKAGEATAYRLARAARLQGAATGSLYVVKGGGEERIVSVHVAGAADGRLLWTVHEEEAPDAAAHESAPYAFARRRADGGLLCANAEFDALPEARRHSLLAAAEAAEAGGRAHAEAPGGAIALMRHGPANTRELFVFSGGGAAAEAFFEAAPVALVRLDLEGGIRAANAEARALLGPGAVTGGAFGDHVEGLSRPISARIAEAAAGRGAGRPDLARAARRDRDLYLQIALRRVETEGEAGVLAVISDATDMEARERQFVQSQKMQAVGQLAGGVAHDFNNLLTAILGHCDLLAVRRDESDPDFEDLTQIRQNANRAAALVRQLLAFSRQQKLNPASADLRDVLGELSHLLNRLIGERVSLRVECAEALWPVWIDAQQFEQVILNLVVNARDAMPEGGEISIACRNETITEEVRRDRASVPAGDYVRIEIADSGEGMSEEVRAKVFEPFFTTKRPGEGTGLGLSTAYGIVKQTGGFIFVDSAPGKGATFTLLMPRHAGAAAQPTSRRAPAAARDLTGEGVILLVEDEAPVRAFAARALRLRGYEVIEAASGEDALAGLDDAELKVDLVVSDVIMPGMDGPAWVREARKARPDLAVIFTSGYAEDMFRKGLGGLENCGFIPKPFSLDGLSAAVKSQLSGAQPAALETMED